MKAIECETENALYWYMYFNPDFVSYFSSNKAYVKGQIWFQDKFF